MAKAGGNKAGRQAALAVDRQLRALELRKAGVTFDRIAQQLGYSGHQGAYKAVLSALQKTLREPAEDVRAMELERLDRLMLGHWEKAIHGDDKATARVLDIMKRRADILGLDAKVPKGDGPAEGDDDPRVVAAMAAGIRAGLAAAGRDEAG